MPCAAHDVAPIFICLPALLCRTRESIVQCSAAFAVMRHVSGSCCVLLCSRCVLRAHYWIRCRANCTIAPRPGVCDGRSRYMRWLLERVRVRAVLAHCMCHNALYACSQMVAACTWSERSERAFVVYLLHEQDLVGMCADLYMACGGLVAWWRQVYVVECCFRPWPISMCYHSRQRARPGVARSSQ